MGVVSIIDYGLNNIVSIARAVALFSDYKIVSTADEIEQSEKLILPGVGSFCDGMASLTNKNLVGAIREYASKGKPILGICLGMQMLFDNSDEFGFTEGLGVLSGCVRKIKPGTTNNKTLKVPHVSWSQLQIYKGESSILNGFPVNGSCYFVHSFCASLDNKSNLVAACRFGDQELVALVNSGRVYGAQFHPEKSGRCGLIILKNFIDNG